MEESVSEWDDTCKGQIKNISRKLAIEKKQQNNFYNLRINNITTKSKLIRINPDDCDNKVTNKKKDESIDQT